MGCALLAVLALAFSSAPASAARSYECQHPLITGEEAVHLRRISPRAACRLGRRLGRWERHNRSRLYACRRPGYRVALRTPRLFGWRLTFSRRHGFPMSRGGASFSVTGTDFPAACN